MLVDLFRIRMVASGSIKEGKGRMNHLVEVCDPSEDDSFAYSVNGTILSDFYTTHYFDPVSSPSIRYGSTGAIAKTKPVLKNGDLSWLDPTAGE